MTGAGCSCGETVQSIAEQAAAMRDLVRQVSDQLGRAQQGLADAELRTTTLSKVLPVLKADLATLDRRLMAAREEAARLEHAGREL